MIGPKMKGGLELPDFQITNNSLKTLFSRSPTDAKRRLQHFWGHTSSSLLFSATKRLDVYRIDFICRIDFDLLVSKPLCIETTVNRWPHRFNKTKDFLPSGRRDQSQRHLSKLISSHITDGQAIRFNPSKWILVLKAGLRRVQSTSTNLEYVGNFFSVFQRWGPQCSFPAEVILLFSSVAQETA